MASGNSKQRPALLLEADFLVDAPASVLPYGVNAPHIWIPFPQGIQQLRRQDITGLSSLRYEGQAFRAGWTFDIRD
jgi:hypothetical protein